MKSINVCLIIVLLLALVCPHRAQAQDELSVFQEGLNAVVVAFRTPDSEMREQMLDRAAYAFHRVLVARPDLPRVRLELARVFFLQGKDQLAKENFERVLASNPPPHIVAAINRFLAEIRARRRWSGYFTFALAPDTNIGTSSGESTFEWLGLRGWKLDSPDKIHSGLGLRLRLGGGYQHPLGRTWRLQMGGHLAHTEYRGSRFDNSTLELQIGPHWFLTPHSEVSLLGVTRLRWVDGQRLYQDRGFRLQPSYRLSRRTRLRLEFSRLDRYYDDRDLLNGPISEISMGANHILTPVLRGDISAGWFLEQPLRPESESAGRWAEAGITALLPKGFALGAFASVRWQDYRSAGAPPRHVIDGSNREDKIYRLRFTVSRRNWLVAGFAPELTVSAETRKSNAQLSEYDRVSGELNFVRQF